MEDQVHPIGHLTADLWIGQITADEVDPVADLVEVPLVAGGQVVHHPHLVTLGDQPVGHV